VTKIWVYDTESDGLTPEATKIHCMVMNELGTDNWRTFTDTGSKIAKIANSGNIFVAHNQLDHDLRLFRKLYNIPFYVGPDTWSSTKCQFWDTLVISRELFPDRPGGHGLEAWGKRVHLWKPEVNDWVNLPVETYVHRCEEDVKINIKTLELLLKEAEIEI